MKFKTIKSMSMLAIALLMVISSSCSNNASGDTEQKEAKIKAPKISIHDATIAGNLEAVEQHIAAGSDLNAKDPFGGSSPLIIAAVFDKPEIAKVLIDAGAKLDMKNNEGSTAIHTAAFFCRTDILQMLLDAGADKNIKNNFGSTALESVSVPFDQVEGIYGMMEKQLGSMGLQIDLKHIASTRPQVANMLR